MISRENWHDGYSRHSKGQGIAAKPKVHFCKLCPHHRGMVNKQKPHAPPGPRQDPRAKSQRSCICLLKKTKNKQKHRASFLLDCTKPNADSFLPRTPCSLRARSGFLSPLTLWRERETGALDLLGQICTKPAPWDTAGNARLQCVFALSLKHPRLFGLHGG